MWLKRTTTHFSPKKQPVANIEEEVQHASTASDVRTLVPLSKEGLEYLKQSYPLVKNENDVEQLQNELKGGNEYGFSPLFDPKLVDACCKRGIFPLTLSIGSNYFIFAPKLHVKRSLCIFDETGRSLIGVPDCDIFTPQKMHPSRKLLKECDPKSKKPAFTVFINRKEDVADVLNLIRRQHTENWLCKALRLCIVYMFEHPELFTTKIIITAIRRAKYDGEEAPVGDDMIHEGELIAGEVGYIVGDIYSSATGGYCMSGAGSLQLAVLGAILHQCGCSVWDLGMRLKYKEECLGSVEVSRRKWVNLAKSRATSSINYENLAIYKNGVPVRQVLKQ